MPIYWGGSGLHKYLPKEAFHYLDLNKNGDDVQEIINGDSYEKNLQYIAKARNILLDELQIWPRIHKAIFGRSK